MRNKLKARTSILALILFAFTFGQAVAADKVVVIPMFGGDSAQWALVDTSQNIIAQSGGISVVFKIEGVVYLNFGKQVIGRPIITTPQHNGGAGFIFTVICGDTPSEETGLCGGIANANGGDIVRINTRNTSNISTNRAFYIVVP